MNRLDCVEGLAVRGVQAARTPDRGHDAITHPCDVVILVGSRLRLLEVTGHFPRHRTVISRPACADCCPPVCSSSSWQRPRSGNRRPFARAISAVPTARRAVKNNDQSRSCECPRGVRSVVPVGQLGSVDPPAQQLEQFHRSVNLLFANGDAFHVHTKRNAFVAGIVSNFCEDPFAELQ